MLRFIFALIKLPRIWNTYTIPVLPTYVGGKREEEKLSMLPEDIGDFSPYMGAVGIETYDGEM